MSVRMPETAGLIPLLTSLLGKSITFVSGVEPLVPSDVEDHLMLFVSDDDAPLMLAGADKAFAYYSGAALGMVPPGPAKEAINSSEKDEDLLENYFEVMNIVTRVVNDQGGDHVRLIPQSSVVLGELPEIVKGAGLDITVEGYGTGKLTFWLF